MAQQVKAPATNPGNWSLIPGTHMVGGENSWLQFIPWPPPIHGGTPLPYTEQTNECENKTQSQAAKALTSP